MLIPKKKTAFNLNLNFKRCDILELPAQKVFHFSIDFLSITLTHTRKLHIQLIFHFWQITIFMSKLLLFTGKPCFFNTEYKNRRAKTKFSVFSETKNL